MVTEANKRKIQLYDSFTRSVRELAPADGDTLRFYCCGPTVYGPGHIGNFRTFILQDVLRRALESIGMKVKHARNLTDVDDKTIRGAMAEGVPLREFTQRWTDRFHEDCAALNVLSPHVEPAATDHINEQIRLIEKLVAGGHAYATPEGSVYFRISSFPDYGKLSRLKEREIKAGAAAHEESGPVDADNYQRDSAADFALWKARKPEDGDNFWPSPWGNGRPGWHIECSAMSMTHLGETFDLHGGGMDLLFPHHENEIAQSEACTRKPFARHWFHGAMLRVEGSKMSKSLGNLYTLKDLRRRGFSAAALRYLLLSGHYRQPLNFTFEALHGAESALEKLARFSEFIAELAGSFAPTPPAADNWGRFEGVIAALSDDLNTPSALGALFKTINAIEANPPEQEEARRCLAAFQRALLALGLNIEKDAREVVIPPEIERIAIRRWEAKQRKDFADADRLREELKAAGWSILDRKDGYNIEPLKSKIQ